MKRVAVIKSSFEVVLLTWCITIVVGVALFYLVDKSFICVLLWHPVALFFWEIE